MKISLGNPMAMLVVTLRNLHTAGNTISQSHSYKYFTNLKLITIRAVILISDFYFCKKAVFRISS